jgi:hypothetical protein
MVDSSVIEKIAKLLQLAEGNANVNEASVAAQKAQELLSRYRLTQADINSGFNKEDIHVEEVGLLFGKKIANWKWSIASALVKINGCKCYSAQNAAGISHIKLVGRDSDIQIIRYFNDYLIREIDRLAAESMARGEIYGKRGSTSFKLGAANSVRSRLLDANKKIRAEAATSSAIVKLDVAELEVADFYNNLSKKLGLRASSRATTSPETDSYNRGHKAGSGIALNKGVGGREVKQLS